MPAIVMKDGKILMRDGRIVVADVDPGDTAPSGCCCGGCDVESCCVAYEDCPDAITITVCPWDYEGGGCVSFVITHQGNGIYRSAGDIDYPAIGGKTGKVLRFETQNWGGLVDQFAIRDSDGMTTWITYSSSCGDGKRLIYNGWQGTSASRARWDSGMTCCQPTCDCPHIDVTGPWGTVRLTERTILDPSGEWEPCYSWDMDDGSGDQGMVTLGADGFGYMDYWPGDGHSYESHFVVCCVDGVLRIKCENLYIDYVPQDCDQYEYGISASNACCGIFENTFGCEYF